MNILFVTNNYPNTRQPQHCIFIQQQAQALCELGHTVDIIVPHGFSCSRKRTIHRQANGLSVHYCTYLQFYKSICLKLITLINIRQFEKNFDFDRYNIISVHMFDEATLRIFTAIAKRHKLKLILHYHGLSVMYDHKLSLPVKLLQHRGNYFLKKLVAKADAIVGVSDKVCLHVKEHFIEIPVYTVYNGVNPRLFYPEEKASSGDYRIISVASLKKLKGNHYLIDAFDLLLKQHKDIKLELIIIGRGPEKAGLKAQVKALKLEREVTFIGYIHYEEVAEIMKNCDVFAMPSYYEALGCAYLEAMACRLPVIGCQYQGIDEIIKDGENGYLVAPHNVLALYEKLDFILTHPEEAAKVAQNGYKTVVSSYTWIDSAKQLTQVYETVCKHPTPGSPPSL